MYTAKFCNGEEIQCIQPQSCHRWASGDVELFPHFHSQHSGPFWLNQSLAESGLLAANMDEVFLFSLTRLVSGQSSAGSSEWQQATARL